MKQVYLYDENGFYNGVYDAQESPREPGIFITPESSTEVVPPASQPNKIAFFNNNEWLLADDFRGELWYDQDTGELIKIENAGTPPSNLSPSAPPLSSEQLLTNFKSDIRTALKKSDIIVVRSYEDNDPVPEEWVLYRKSLRNLLSSDSFITNVLPEPPAYPV